MNTRKNDDKYDTDSPKENKKDRYVELTKEFEEVLKKSNGNDVVALTYLKNKYKDPKVVTKVFSNYTNNLQVLLKQAVDFKRKLYNKYGTLHLPTPKIIEKASKYSKKYSFRGAVFDFFIKMVLSESSAINYSPVAMNKMTRALGFTNDFLMRNKLNYKEEDLDTINEILVLYNQTRPLHDYIKKQSLMYQDCAVVARMGEFDRPKHNPFVHVDPVVVALFLPKIAYVDYIFIHSNIGCVIQHLLEHTLFRRPENYETYLNIATDPNEFECPQIKNNPFVDILKRYRIQIKLWESIFDLRQGKYYNEKSVDLLTILKDCTNIYYDAPELAYYQDEGTVMRKIFGALSIRPTVISLDISNNNLFAAIHPHLNITTIPMMVLYLPVANAGTSLRYDPNIPQYRYFIHNKMIVRKNVSILHSRDVFVLHVPRRKLNVSYGKLINPVFFSSLPVTISGVESLNDVELDVEFEFPIDKCQFNLRSVVLVEESKELDNTIIGRSAVIRSIGDWVVNRDCAYYYNPQAVYDQELYEDASTIQYAPIYKVPIYNDIYDHLGKPVKSMANRARTNGTVYIFARENSDNLAELLRQIK